MDKNDKILIVDDEPANLFLLELILEDNYTIVKTNNGREALDLIEKEVPDLILLDIMMPGMDGLEVCKAIVSNELTKDIPIILVTAKIQDEDVEKGLNLGATDYIKKPISDVELKARVKSALRIKHREDELKRLNKIKNDFIRIISHDILSPFTGILSSSNILLNKDFGNPLNEIQKELIKIINGSAQKQLNYVKDLLLLALQERDTFNLDLEEIPLKKLIDESIDIHKFSAQRKNISLINNISDNIIMKLDMNKIAQVFNNLINNAIKFTQKGGQVDIFSERKEDKIFISVKDNGTGMKEEKINELSGEGKVYSTPGTDEEVGTGLGLKICKKILKAHNGTILIDSKEGEGSTFTMVLPL